MLTLVIIAGTGYVINHDSETVVATAGVETTSTSTTTPPSSTTSIPETTTTVEPSTTTAAPETTTTTKAPAPTTTTKVPSTDVLLDTKSCASFASREEAQAELDWDPSDPHNIDTDNDGQACTAYNYGGYESEDMGETPVPASTSGANWDALAQCESGGNWAYPTVSGGFSGGLMFHYKTWNAMGGQQYAPYAYLATREQQIAIAEKVLAVQGRMAWPGCTKANKW